MYVEHTYLFFTSIPYILDLATFQRLNKLLVPVPEILVDLHFDMKLVSR